jgi:hypothetical protein
MPGIPSKVVGLFCSVLLHGGAIALVAAQGGAPVVGPLAVGGPAPLRVMIVHERDGLLPLPALLPPAAVTVAMSVPVASRPGAVRGQTARRAPRMNVSVLPPEATVPAPLPSLPPLTAPPQAPMPSAPRAMPPLPPSLIPVAMNVMPDRPVRVSPDEAKALRYHDVYPSLPDAVRLEGTRLRVMVDVCVSAAGAVDQVTFAPGTSDLLSQLLRPAIAEWRYHSLEVAGVATAFCHLVRLEYRVP